LSGAPPNREAWTEDGLAYPGDFLPLVRNCFDNLFNKNSDR
jgi:hypothetical protein